MMYRSFASARLALLTITLMAGAISAPGCSSKPAEIDTAEVVPDPAVKPAPVPSPAVSSAAGAVENTPPSADEPKP